MMNFDVRSIFRPCRSWCVFLAALGVAALFSPQSHAQRVSSADRLNEETFTVVSSSPNGTSMPIAYDMSAALDDGDNLRILVVLGQGDGQSIKDLRFLTGVDPGNGATRASAADQWPD